MRGHCFFPWLAIVVGTACSAGTTPPGARTRPPPSVTVSTVTTRDVPVTIQAPVDLRPLSTADVGSKTLGYLDAVLADRGDRVHKGQLLALVRPSETPGQIAVAKGDLAKSEAATSLARSSFERVKALVPNAAASQQELQQAASTLAASEAGETAAHAQIDALGKKLGETRITAPMDGVVAWRRLDPGALVGPATGPVMTVVRTDVLRVFIPVNERDLRGVSVGKNAFVTFDALPDRRTAGKVVRLAPALDPATRTLEAEVQLRNDSGDLRPGMYGRASIVVETHPGAPVVPPGALQRTEDAVFAYVVTGDVARRHKVRLGVEDEDWVEILGGLRPGDEVVVAGIESLSDGAKVRAVRGIDAFTGTKDKAGVTRGPEAAQPAAGPR